MGNDDLILYHRKNICDFTLFYKKTKRGFSK